MAAQPHVTPPAPAPPPFLPSPLLCAICLREGREMAATTIVNGAALCKDDAMVAPRGALPYAT